MGTRSTFIVTGPTRYKSTATYRLYKHWDGYPTGNLPIIEKALERAQRFIQENKGELPAETLTGLLIGESTSEHGIGAKLEWEGGELSPEAFGEQGDLEWIYVIDTSTMTLRIYGGDYGATVGPKTTDPLTYASRLVASAQASERAETKELVRSIEAWGLKVNPL